MNTCAKCLFSKFADLQSATWLKKDFNTGPF